jgi:hypothetical protein
MTTWYPLSARVGTNFVVFFSFLEDEGDMLGQGQGQGYITTNNQSVSMSWYRAQSRTIDQSLLSP